MDLIVAVDRVHLEKLVRHAMHSQGPRCTLNHIDVGGIRDFSWLFAETEFDGDVSRWNMSNATNITAMFRQSYFTGDVSRWDVSNVVQAGFLFSYCPFDSDISGWDTSKMTHMNEMFGHSGFSGDVASWKVGSALTMAGMFSHSEFHGDLSAWRPRHVYDVSRMFEGLPYQQRLDAWTPHHLNNASAMLSSENLHRMQHPCFYHWYAALYQHHVLPPLHSEHLANVLPIARAMARSEAGVASVIQEEWLRQQTNGGEILDAIVLPLM